MKIEISEHKLDSWIEKLEKGEYIILHKELEQLKRDKIVEKIDRKVSPTSPIQPETSGVIPPKRPDTMRCPMPPYLKVWF